LVLDEKAVKKGVGSQELLNEDVIRISNEVPSSVERLPGVPFFGVCDRKFGISCAQSPIKWLYWRNAWKNLDSIPKKKIPSLGIMNSVDDASCEIRKGIVNLFSI